MQDSFVHSLFFYFVPSFSGKSFISFEEAESLYLFNVFSMALCFFKIFDEYFQEAMHYELKQKSGAVVFELAATFKEEDYNSFIKTFENLSVFQVNNLWFNFKAKILHDIGTTFAHDNIIMITATDTLFPNITYLMDMTGHLQCYDDCADCCLKDFFANEFIKYDEELEQMLATICEESESDESVSECV